MDPLSVTVSTAQGLPVVSVRGEVDISSVGALDDALDAQFDAGACSVVVDFLGVTFLDSTGLSALVRAHRRSTEQGGRLALVMDDPQLLRLLSISGLDRLIPSFATLDAALADRPQP
jgi:anti-sigma B factor antagonist